MIDLPRKALSVRQPWAWAIVHGGKDIENRVAQAVTLGRMTTGPVCIHASKGMTRKEYDRAREFMAGIGVECPRPDVLIRGAIIGTAYVDDIVKQSESPWFFGPRGLALSGAEAVDPIPAGGQLGYFDWKPAGAAEAPLPWMAAWPGGRGRDREAPLDADLPLFGASR